MHSVLPDEQRVRDLSSITPIADNAGVVCFLGQELRHCVRSQSRLTVLGEHQGRYQRLGFIRLIRFVSRSGIHSHCSESRFLSQEC